MLYQNIKQLCKESKINIFRLERALGFGNGTIQYWKKASPQLKNVKRVADYFGVSVDELMK